MQVFCFNRLFPKKKANFTIDASPPPSSSSSSSQGYDYEVFLSFSGDTRTGFADYLYNDLTDAGIQAYRDGEDLPVGKKIRPELLTGIKSSKICIPIFSTGYASSKWCLLELSQMTQCMDRVGQMILPIFYDVEPAEVRHQSGSYEKAFRDHQKRFDDQTVRQWRKALREVGTMRGFDLKKTADGHAGSLVKTLVTKILKDLKKNYMVVSDYLVGIDHHVEIMTSFLKVESGGVLVVGIHGMGGVGKTTIAKVIYNQLAIRFESCCFLTDIKEALRPKDLVDLQNHLISSVLKRQNLSVFSVGEGMNMIKQRFCNKKVLIVLDDVDKMEQLDALAQKRTWFGSGSRIIVTTRNKEVLNVHNLVDEIYEPPEMDDAQALQLLCKHAFRNDCPPRDYMELSCNVASTTGGLPLALEIIGSFLSGKSKEVWEQTSKKLKHIPNCKVQKKLKLSYDALDHEQKQIFLDTACMLIGVDKRVACHMWDDCGFYPEHSIEVLVNMSLVKIGDRNELRMHDHLRDLGKEIVRQESYSKPGERSRLWSHDEALNVLEKGQGTSSVVALCLDFEERPYEFSITNTELGKLTNLRLLQVDFTCLNGDFKGLFSSLRWLRWCGARDDFMPTNLCVKNLVNLDLSQGEFTNDWKGWEEMKVAKRLKFMNLSYCVITVTPDFAPYANLEELILTCCKSLVKIHPSMWNLRALKLLNLSCTGITELSRDMGMLEKLEVLDASDCLSLKAEIPGEIGNLSRLRELMLCNTKICSLPTSMQLLTGLRDLSLRGCTELQTLPEEFPASLELLHVTCKFMKTCSFASKLVRLQGLFFSDCPELLQIPREICALSRLGTLRFESCNKLRYLSGLPCSIWCLSLECCESVEMVEVPKSPNQLCLNFARCPKLIDIKGVENLKCTSVKIRHCGISLENGDVGFSRVVEKVEGPCSIHQWEFPFQPNPQVKTRFQTWIERDLSRMDEFDRKCFFEGFMDPSDASYNSHRRIKHFRMSNDPTARLRKHVFADNTVGLCDNGKPTVYREGLFFSFGNGDWDSSKGYLWTDNLHYEIFRKP